MLMSAGVGNHLERQPPSDTRDLDAGTQVSFTVLEVASSLLTNVIAQLSRPRPSFAAP